MVTKISLKCEFALLQFLSRLFHLVQFAQLWRRGGGIRARQKVGRGRNACKERSFFLLLARPEFPLTLPHLTPATQAIENVEFNKNIWLTQ